MIENYNKPVKIEELGSTPIEDVYKLEIDGIVHYIGFDLWWHSPKNKIDGWIDSYMMKIGNYSWFDLE